jgi:hypothetical protein
MTQPQTELRPQKRGEAASAGSAGWRSLALGAGMLTVAAGAALWFGAGQGGPAQRTSALTPASRPPARAAPTASAAAPPAQLPDAGPRPVPAPPSAPAPQPLPRFASSAPAPAPVRPAPEVVARAAPAPSLVGGAPQPLPAAEPQACLLSVRPAPNRFGRGVVVALEDPATAAALTRKREAELGGPIDPEYGSARQAAVRLTNGDEVVFNIPRSLEVRLGDGVTTQNIHRSLNLPCSYTPAIITADLGPEPLPMGSPRPSPAPVVAAAAPSEASADSGQSCPIILPSEPHHAASGIVRGFVAPSQVFTVIARGEAHARGRIDPAYIDLPRIVVDVNGHGNIVTVPHALVVRVGDRVAIQEGYRAHGAECRWAPNLVTDDFGPAQTPAPGSSPSP